jgi:short-subunit dehydrogenase
MYTSTKTAILNFSELLRKRIKTRGIYIQALCPGLTYTEFHDTESMRGFKRTMYPEESWMNVKDVVSLSLNAVKTKRVIFIPGELNKTLSSELRNKTVESYLNCERL